MTESLGRLAIVESSAKLSTTRTKPLRTGASRKQAVNQTLSCAECRRLKLRCDRVFPCSSCQKRGIAELCPEGSLPTRNKPGTSSTDKEQLYQNISELRGRVLELENALEVAHAAISSEPHPLLGDENFNRKTSSRRKRVSDDTPDDEDQEEQGALDEALGSLSVGEGGRARFFGRSACVERLFKYQNNGVLATPEEPNILVSAEVAMIYQSFPMLTIGEATELVQERIWRHLPPLDRAQALCRAYKRHVYHITDIVPEESDWFSDLFSRVYQNIGQMNSPLVSFSDSGVRMDELALLFAYFALAALMDLDLKPFNYEAEAYACLSRAALTSMNMLKHPTIVTVEALVLLGYFEAMWGEIIGSGDGWIITTLATKLAQLIGIHRNSRQLGMEPIESERRSRVYWELYTLELIEVGFSHGRPATFSLIPSDVEMPPCRDSKANLHIFRYRLAAECLSPMSKKVFGVKMPPYATIVELDRKIRTFCADHGVDHIGQSTSIVGLNEDEAMVEYTKRVLRESTLLYLHRAFFARAVTANPSDPQHTKYGLSVSGAYESAMSLVQALSEISHDHLAPSSRALLCWNHTLCSVFILGSINTCCPGSRLAPLAAKRLHDVDGLYDRAGVYGGRASADKPLVSRMAQKCDEAAYAYAKRHGKPARDTFTQPSPSPENGKHSLHDEIDELAVLGGRTRIVGVSTTKAPPKASMSPSLSQAGTSPSQRNISPFSTDTSSIADSGSFFEQRNLLHGTNPVSLDLEGQGPSPPSDTAEHHASSGDSASGGLSPEDLSSLYMPTYPNISTQSEISGKPGDAIHTQKSGGHFNFNNSLEPVVDPAGHNDVVRIVKDSELPGHLSMQYEYMPMEISTDVPEPLEWNFLDIWYGHVYSLDVVPPDYGH